MRKRERERESVMYNIIYTVQLGLHLVEDQSKEVTSFIRVESYNQGTKRRGRAVVGFTILWGESLVCLSHEHQLKSVFKNYSLLPSQQISV